MPPPSDYQADLAQHTAVGVDLIEKQVPGPEVATTGRSKDTSKPWVRETLIDHLCRRKQEVRGALIRLIRVSASSPSRPILRAQLLHVRISRSPLRSASSQTTAPLQSSVGHRMSGLVARSVAAPRTSLPAYRIELAQILWDAAVECPQPELAPARWREGGRKAEDLRELILEEFDARINRHALGPEVARPDQSRDFDEDRQVVGKCLATTGASSYDDPTCACHSSRAPRAQRPAEIATSASWNGFLPPAGAALGTRPSVRFAEVVERLG